MTELIHNTADFVQAVLKYAALITVFLAAVALVLFLLKVAFPKDAGNVQIVPFKVTTTAGLEVSESSLAILTNERLKVAQDRVLLASDKARKLLNERKLLSETGEVTLQALEDKKTEVDTLFPGIDPAMLASITTSGGSEIKKVSFEFQSVDWGGIINWVVDQFKPDAKTVQFHLMHECIGEKCTINIWGDVKNFGLSDKKIVWVDADDAEVYESIDLLAYRLIQVLAAKSDTADTGDVLRTTPEEFRDSVNTLLDTVALLMRHKTFSDPQFLLPKPA